MSGPQDSLVGRGVEELETPVLLVDLDRLDGNIATMRRIILDDAGIGWRPHIKGLKVPGLAHKLLGAGALGVTCAKLGEAEVMAEAGIRDILIANQVVGRTKVARLARLLRHADVIVAVDGDAQVRELAAATEAAGTRGRVVVEVNMGLNRAGVEPGEAVVALGRHVAGCAGLRFVGVMGWEGQTAGIADPLAKRKAVEEAVGRLTASADACRAAGLPVEIVSCGGTGTYWIACHLAGVTEVQAGGGVFCDVHYRQDFGVEHEYALTILTTVTSRPTARRIVCDAGWKAMGQHPVLPVPRGLEAELRSVRLSAEHATIELTRDRPDVAVGDRVEFVAGYTDSTVFLHDHLYGVRGGVLEVVWPIAARGRIR